MEYPDNLILAIMRLDLLTEDAYRNRKAKLEMIMKLSAETGCSEGEKQWNLI